jgi:SecD/SecF fusion protein
VCNYDKGRYGRGKGEIAMKNQKSKGILIIFAFIVLFAASAYTVFCGLGAQHKGKASNIRLGLDLAGGVSITYQIKDSNVSETEINDTIQKIQQRVEQYST